MTVEGVRRSCRKLASGDLVDQPSRGERRAIGAHRGCDGARTGRYVWLESVAEVFVSDSAEGVPGACAVPIPNWWTLFAQ